MEGRNLPIQLDVVRSAHIVGKPIIENAGLVGFDLIHDGRLGAVLIVIGRIFHRGVARLPHTRPVRRDVIAIDVTLCIGNARPYRMGGQEPELGYLRPNAVPNYLHVALSVQLQVEAQLPEDILVGVLKEALRLQPLVGLLLPVGSVEPIAVNHLRHPIHNGRLDTRPEIQVPEVVAVEIVETIVYPIAAGLLGEEGQLMRR